MSTDLKQQFNHAAELAEQGSHAEARRLYGLLDAAVGGDAFFRGRIANDLGVLDALDGNWKQAAARFEQSCNSVTGGGHTSEAARSNLALLRRLEQDSAGRPPLEGSTSTPIKVAVLSFLFNWPSTGGGIVHTVELCSFLARDGFDVRLYYPEYAPWRIGAVDATCPFPGESLRFDDADWKVDTIKCRFRQAVDSFAPDYVIITDCWNFKPHLAEAVADYPYLLRMQAHECLCPLNNLRLLPEPTGLLQCSNHQLKNPQQCVDCLQQRGNTSGALHQAERALGGVGTPEYQDLLQRSLQYAEAVLVLNPDLAQAFRPYARRVRVVTWGMNSTRFPWPPGEESSPNASALRTGDGADPTASDSVTTLLFAGLMHESIKGFHVLHAACTQLWRDRQDFRLLVTSEPPGRLDAFTERVGWQSQEALPAWYRQADICVVPTIAQDALSRTAVEAMASGRPVIASRIGGLPFTVADGETGLLCNPGDVDDWAAKIRSLLDNPQLWQRMGLAGRQVFEDRFTWETVIGRDYRPLLAQKSCQPVEPVQYEDLISAN